MHAILIFILNAIGSVVLALVASAAGGAMSTYWVVLLVNIIFAGGGFAYAAYHTPEMRWTHLVAVALVFWGAYIVLPILGVATFSKWLLAIFRIMALMVIGGGTGILIEKLRSR